MLENSSLLGSWKNTLKSGHHMATLELTASGEVLQLHPVSDIDGRTVDWGLGTTTDLYNNKKDLTEIQGFVAYMQVEDRKATLVGTVKLGVLVIQMLFSYENAESGAPYFTREFFTKI